MDHLYQYKTHFLLTAITHRPFRGRYQHSAAQVEKPTACPHLSGFGKPLGAGAWCGGGAHRTTLETCCRSLCASVLCVCVNVQAAFESN